MPNDLARHASPVLSQPASTTSETLAFKRGITVTVDHGRDDLLTDFGRATLVDRYLMPGETFQTMFARVAAAYADDSDHAQRLYDYISRLWFMPATPVLSNGGTERGLPISCFLNEVEDSMEGISSTWNENIWLASRGGGIGTNWSNVRSIGEKVGEVGKTSGIIPFIRVMDSLTLAISQGSLRRGSAAAYLRIDHPEVEEFLEVRKQSGDFNRKAFNLHHGLVISDTFMEAVRDDAPWDLISPKTGDVLKTISARSLFIKILETRMATGEPYLLFEDTVNRAIPEHHKKLGLKVKTSNLCSEITLPTGRDHKGNMRTAVCCLSSVNIEKWDEWSVQDSFIEDILRMLDNVLTDFIENAPDAHSKAKYSAMRERSVGLGAMGWHSFLQSKGIPFESAMAKSWNIRVAKHIKANADAASRRLAEERGPCPDAADAGVMERFSNKLAVAPTASISIIAGGTSACYEPIPANIYTHKTLSGSFSVRNRHLKRLLAEKGRDTDETWQSIIEHEGSVQHLDFLSDIEKDIFKTAFEIDQRWVVELAGDRAPFICQAQSINLFLLGDCHKWDLLMLHFSAWERGVKSLYYLRTKSVQRASYAGAVDTDNKLDQRQIMVREDSYDECLACQ